MYIYSIRIQNYRCFKDTTVEFTPGVNVIIGENNAGKTALLKAIGLVFDRRQRKSIARYDFHQMLDDYGRPPEVKVTITLQSSGLDTSDDKALVAAWITKLEHPWEAQLTYLFFLPEEDHQGFSDALHWKPSDLSENEHFWNVVEQFLPRYIARIYGGKFEANNRAEPDALSKFDYQFLDAIRDAESELFSGSNPLLKYMLRQILDDPDLVSSEQKEAFRDSFRLSSRQIFEDNLIPRLNVDKLFKLASQTGAIDGGTPGLDGRVTEYDLIAALRLTIEQNMCRLPVDHNGLGYNNLLYISLVLASLNFDTDPAQRGQNTVLFPMLVIEEPEAHLHPALQFKLLKHIKMQQNDADSGSRQVFITTHSTHITSASSLDDIICMVAYENGTVRPAYPGKVYGTDVQSVTSKKYVERYLDATKSTMLFSKGIIFVEGMTEQLLVPCLANYIDESLEDHHIAVIPVGGLNFKHFLPIFGAGLDTDKKGLALERPVACLIDADPARKDRYKDDSRFQKCWPYQLHTEPDQYDYKAVSDTLNNLYELSDGTENIRVFYGEKTFEYDFAYVNPFNEHLISGSGTHVDALYDLISDSTELPISLDRILTREGVKEYLTAIPSNDDQQAALFATIYLITLDNVKGEHAFDVDHHLRQLLDDDPDLAKQSVNVPAHIEDAIWWACGV